MIGVEVIITELILILAGGVELFFEFGLVVFNVLGSTTDALLLLFEFSIFGLLAIGVITLFSLTISSFFSIITSLFLFASIIFS